MIFESILTEAAEKTKAKEAHSLAVEEQRRQELHEMAAEIDLAMDRRRGRKARVLTWDYFRPLIEELKGKGASDNEVAKELCEQGFSTSLREVYAYRVKNGIQDYIKEIKPSKFDDHTELIVQMRSESKSFYQIRLALQRQGFAASTGGIANFVQRRKL